MQHPCYAIFRVFQILAFIISYRKQLCRFPIVVADCGHKLLLSAFSGNGLQEKTPTKTRLLRLGLAKREAPGGRCNQFCGELQINEQKKTRNVQLLRESREGGSGGTVRRHGAAQNFLDVENPLPFIF